MYRYSLTTIGVCVLTISGTGDMYDYELGKGYGGTDTSDSPWNGQYRKQIKKIVVSDGDYVWTLKVTAPSEDTDFYFDLRDATTNKYLKDYFIFSFEF